MSGLHFEHLRIATAWQFSSWRHHFHQ